VQNLLSLALKVFASLLGGSGTADEVEYENVVSYKPKGPNGEVVQVYEVKDKECN